MTPEQILRELEGHMAYDQGSTDSGVHDPVRRRILAEKLDALGEQEFSLSMSRFIREAYLTEDALGSGYGWEDALSFSQWIQDGDYRP